MNFKEKYQEAKSKPEAMRKRQVSLSFTNYQIELLDELAKESFRSRSGFFTKVLQDYIDERLKEEEQGQ